MHIHSLNRMVSCHIHGSWWPQYWGLSMWLLHTVFYRSSEIPEESLSEAAKPRPPQKWGGLRLFIEIRVMIRNRIRFWGLFLDVLCPVAQENVSGLRGWYPCYSLQILGARAYETRMMRWREVPWEQYQYRAYLYFYEIWLECSIYFCCCQNYEPLSSPCKLYLSICTIV